MSSYLELSSISKALSDTNTSSPLLVDTAILFALQGAFYLLSRRFLTSALPTLRQMSSNTEGVTLTAIGNGDVRDDGSVARSRRGSRGNVISASGTESGHHSRSGSRSHTFGAGGKEVGEEGRMDDDAEEDRDSVFEQDSISRSLLGVGSYQREEGGQRDDDDTEDGASLFSYAGSPAPTTPPTLGNDHIPLLPLHNHAPGADEEGGLDMGKLGRKLKEVSIRTFPDVLSVPKSGGGKVKTLRLFHGRPTSKKGSRSHANDTSGRVRHMRGLGWIARTLFSLCFAESLTLLALVMFHSLGILHSRSLHVHFSLSLHILLLLILLIVPMVQCLQLTYRARDSSTSVSTRRSLTPMKRFILALVPFCLYVFVFTRIPPYVTTDLPTLAVEVSNYTSLRPVKTSGRIAGHLPTSIHLGDIADLEERPDVPFDSEVLATGGSIWTSQQELWQHGGWLEPSLGRVVVCGIIILGLLSGFGAIRTAWMFYENGGLRRGRAISREDVLNAERSLYRVRHDQAAKREQLVRRSDVESPQQDPSWLGRVLGSSWSGDREVANIKRELEGLQAMEAQVSKSLEAMKIQRRRQRFSQTLRGRIFNAVGFVFALYCVARIVMCLTSVFFPPLATNHVGNGHRDSSTQDAIPGHGHGNGNTNGDWISYLIALAISQIPGIEDVTTWSRAISLILTGILILSSLNQILRNVSRILRLTSKSIGAGFLLLSLAQLMSTYVISLLIQLRSSLPPSLPDDVYNDTETTLKNATSSISTGLTTIPETTGDPSLLATLPDFRVFGRLFDVVFLIAALGSGLWRWLSMKMSVVDEFGDVYHT